MKLNHPLKDNITEILGKIADELKFSFHNTSNTSLGLLSGDAGIALFLFYYSRFRRETDIENLAMSYLERAVSRINKNFIHSFCDGISGLCWTVHHLINEGFLDEENKEILEPFDSILCRAAIYELNNNNPDFLHGGTGTLCYLLNRIQVDYVFVSIEKSIEILDKKKQIENGTYFWYYYNPLEGKLEKNICISHGMASLLIFLSKAYKLNIKKDLIKKIIDPALLYLLKQEVDFAGVSLFPSYPKGSPKYFSYSRLGWCYGDLGIALALWHCANAFNENALLQKALEIFNHSANRKKLQENAIIDGGLCHGTAGLAMIFRRMYKNTNANNFCDTAGYWLEQTVKMSKFEDGLAGYKSNEKDLETDVISGISGIGLVLLTFLTDNDPVWDESFLLT